MKRAARSRDVVELPRLGSEILRQRSGSRAVSNPARRILANHGSAIMARRRFNVPALYARRLTPCATCSRSAAICPTSSRPFGPTLGERPEPGRRTRSARGCCCRGPYRAARETTFEYSAPPSPPTPRTRMPSKNRETRAERVVGAADSRRGEPDI